MHKLVLVRHGQSVWNLARVFTGWTDVDLTIKGSAEAVAAGRGLRDAGFAFDVAYTSVLKRAIRTLWIMLDEMDLMWIPVHRSWRLNERHYGALQGLSKIETAEREGAERVHVWRRSYGTPPPALSKTDPRYPGGDPRYAMLSDDELPTAECLKDTIERMMPYWHGKVAPALRAGKRVIVAAHGNTIRGLVKHLDQISDADIPDLNIPTGIPLVYELDDNLNAIRHYYVGNPEGAAAAGAY